MAMFASPSLKVCKRALPEGFHKARAILSVNVSAQHDSELEKRQSDKQDADQKHGNVVKIPFLPDIHVRYPLSAGLSENP